MMKHLMQRFVTLLFAITPVVSAAASEASNRQVPGLSFPDKPINILQLTAPRPALIKPRGEGPFPAVVLHHQCAGLRRGRWTNQSMLEWTRFLATEGFVVLLVDSLGPRGVDSVCNGPKGGVDLLRGARDATDAADHLRKLPFVDRDKVFHVGFSWGAMVGLFANSHLDGQVPGFTAYAGFYPGCHATASGITVGHDLKRRHLVLLAGKDTETPASECVGRFSALKLGDSRIDWHIYPDASHCFDCSNLDGFSKLSWQGVPVVYRYDRGATSDAQRRLVDHLRKP